VKVLLAVMMVLQCLKPAMVLLAVVGLPTCEGAVA